MKPQKDPRPLLRRLANLLQETSDCLNQLIESIGDEEEPGRSDVDAPPHRPTDWELVLEVSATILREVPDRTWRWKQFGAELRNRGVTLTSWRGVASRLVAELKTRGIVRVEGGSFQVALAVDDQSSVSTKSEPRTSATSSSSTTALPWDELVQESERLLANHVGERWTGSALCQELRQRVTLKSWKCVPLGLVWKLHARRVVEARRDGSFVVLARRHGEATPAQESDASVAAHDTSPPRPSIADPNDGDDVDGLVEEIDAVTGYLVDLPQRQVRSQLCLWAGRARRIHDTLGNRSHNVASALKDALKGIFRRLLELTRKHGPGWIDALSHEWSTDWDVYITYHQAIVGGYEPDLTAEQERAYHRDILRGLFIGHRRVGRDEAHRAMLEALPMVTDGDVVASKAIQRFGRPPERRVENAGPPPSQRRGDRELVLADPPEVQRDLPDEVLELTRGKRMLIAGGQGAREAHREAIRESFGLAEVEWVTTERGKASPFNRLEARMRPGRYDIVLFLASHSSHQAGGFVRACKDAEIPLVFLSRGYSVTSVAQAISQQLLSRGATDSLRTARNPNVSGDRARG